MFSSVVVVTDRLSLDQNIKKTISQLSKVTGQVVMIGRDERGNAVSDGSKSSQLVEALRSGGPAPIPLEEILEVSRVTIEVADAAG